MLVADALVWLHEGLQDGDKEGEWHFNNLSALFKEQIALWGGIENVDSQLQQLNAKHMLSEYTNKLPQFQKERSLHEDSAGT